MSHDVSIFVTCLVDQLFPNVGLSMVTVLERLGYRVSFPDAQTCCGQPAFNSGYREDARKIAKHFLEVFRGVEYIIVPSGSCTSMIAHHFSELFPSGSEEADAVKALQSRVVEFSAFLTNIAKVENVGASLSGVATYHDSCHALRELKIKDGPRRLLKQVRGLELREMDIAAECCGFGGTFSVKFAEISSSMARTKLESVKRTGANVVISLDSSCLMQIQGAILREGLPIRTMHLAEVLAST